MKDLRGLHEKYGAKFTFYTYNQVKRKFVERDLIITIDQIHFRDWKELGEIVIG